MRRESLAGPPGVRWIPGQPSRAGVLVLAGSRGRAGESRARLLAEQGALAESIQWFGGPGQHAGPWEIAVETFQARVSELAAGCDRVILIGLSFGAEAALLTAAAIAVECIPAVVLVAGGDDQVWPAGLHAELIARRRARHQLPTTVITEEAAGYRAILPGEPVVTGGCGCSGAAPMRRTGGSAPGRARPWPACWTLARHRPPSERRPAAAGSLRQAQPGRPLARRRGWEAPAACGLPAGPPASVPCRPACSGSTTAHRRTHRRHPGRADTPPGSSRIASMTRAAGCPDAPARPPAAEPEPGQRRAATRIQRRRTVSGLVGSELAQPWSTPSKADRQIAR
jgi:hypothetical protein